ncbi:unnamed protein product [Caenorhabditis angaria]|uniref:Uncharacterized protein n=1 Tax=Caenorhabditis angaria TaxID=860376 RepID=A0A9P1IZE6_9PELO|nr:unnamed protein product [Caenorhabditis angaria]
MQPMPNPRSQQMNPISSTDDCFPYEAPRKPAKHRKLRKRSELKHQTHQKVQKIADIQSHNDGKYGFHCPDCDIACNKSHMLKKIVLSIEKREARENFRLMKKRHRDRRARRAQQVNRETENELMELRRIQFSNFFNHDDFQDVFNFAPAPRVVTPIPRQEADGQIHPGNSSF